MDCPQIVNHGIPDNLSVGWQPPAYADLSFTPAQCKVSTDWLASWALAVQQDDKARMTDATGLVEYLETMLPRPSNLDHLDSLGKQEYLAAWGQYMVVNWEDIPEDSWPNETASYHYINATMTRMICLPMTRPCHQQLCAKLEFEGDPDITGKGMLASYYMLATLTLLYAIVLPVAERRMGRKEWPRWTERVLEAFRETLPTFLDAALIFALAMAMAGVTRYASFIKHKKRYESFYALLTSVYMSTATILPTIVLQILAGRSRRNTLRFTLWLCIVAFIVALAVLYHVVYPVGLGEKFDSPARWSQQLAQEIWLDLCDMSDWHAALRVILRVALVVLAVNFVLLVYVVLKHAVYNWSTLWQANRQGDDQGGGDSKSRSHTSTSDTRTTTKTRRAWHIFTAAVKIIDVVVCIVLLWVMVACLHVYRHRIAQRAKSSDEDVQWTFGQVLALAAWAGVALDLLTIMIYGVEGGLTRKLSKNYRVVATESHRRHLDEKDSSQHRAATY